MLAVMKSVIILSFVMLSFVMLRVIELSGIVNFLNFFNAEL